MENPSKIPVVFLLKKSREECGALKSYIQELEDIIKEKDKQIAKLQEKNEKLKLLHTLKSPYVHVYSNVAKFKNNKDKLIPKVKDPDKRNKRIVKLYKKMAHTYEDWYNGCKQLITLMDDLKNNR